MNTTNIIRNFYLAMLLLLGGLAFSQSPDAQKILAKADDAFKLDKIYNTSSLIITRNGRNLAEQKLEGYSLTDKSGTAQSLTIFTAPARVKGTAYLTIGDGLWVRFSSTGRIRKLSSSARKNSAGGSDFAYADLGDGNKGYSDKYDATYDGEEDINGTAQYRLILAPKPNSQDDTYEKLIVWIAEDTGYFRQIQFWDKGAPIKLMILEDFQNVGGIDYPFKVTMKSLVKNSVSVITTDSFENDSDKVKQNLFNTRYLESL